MNKRVCIPVLSILYILYFRIQHLQGRYTFYYEILPRWYRGVKRILVIQDATFEKYLGLLTGCRFQHITHGDTVKDYSNIRMNSYIQMVEIGEKLTPHFINDPWIAPLYTILGEEASKAAVIKFFAHNQLHLYYFPIVLCFNSIVEEENETMLAVCPAYWPKELFNIIKNDFGYTKINFISPPLFFNIINKINILYKVFILIIGYLIKFGIRIQNVKKKEYKVFSEFFDPELIGKKLFDIDFFIDNINFTYNDALFFVTEFQLKELKKNGYNKTELNKFAKEKGINLVILSDLSFTLSSIWNLLRLFTKLFSLSFYKQTSIASNLYPYILNEYLMHAPLFLHYKSVHLLHYQSPFGSASWRWNSAVVTGLCRMNRVHSNGIQSRVFDAKEYEFCFDCYDTYFAWGEAWIKMMGSAFKYAGDIVYTGVFTLPDLLKTSNMGIEDSIPIRENQNNWKYQVMIFPTEVQTNLSAYNGNFYTHNYVIDFLTKCAQLAAQYPDILFICKPKDPVNIELIKSDEKFREVYNSLQGNFIFLNRGRMNYWDILQNSDIALSIGFTSPGLDALLAGKRSIYYSHFRNAGSVFETIPNYVVKSSLELNALFLKIINSNLEWGKVSENALYELDPYHDGKSKERIIKNLSLNKRLLNVESSSCL